MKRAPKKIFKRAYFSRQCSYVAVCECDNTFSLAFLMVTLLSSTVVKGASVFMDVDFVSLFLKCLFFPHISNPYTKSNTLEFRLDGTKRNGENNT